MTGSTDQRTVRLVVLLLGGITIVLATGYIWLLREVIHQAASVGPVDPATLAAIGALGPLVGVALGAFGSLLTSTRSPDAVQDVQVVNSGPGEEVPVDVAPPA